MLKTKVIWPENDLERKGYARAMKDRCEIAGHEWENACSIVFQLYELCKWYGEIR
jgi:hypothetical protein